MAATPHTPPAQSSITTVGDTNDCPIKRVTNFQFKPHSCCCQKLHAFTPVHYVPGTCPRFSPCHYRLFWWHSTFISSRWPHWLKALSQQQPASINSWSDVLLYKLSLCALGRREEKGGIWGFKVETRPPSTYEL